MALAEGRRLSFCPSRHQKRVVKFVEKAENDLSGARSSRLLAKGRITKDLITLLSR
jgi:hypothetical protein